MAAPGRDDIVNVGGAEAEQPEILEGSSATINGTNNGHSTNGDVAEVEHAEAPTRFSDNLTISYCPSPLVYMNPPLTASDHENNVVAAEAREPQVSEGSSVPNIVADQQIVDDAVTEGSQQEVLEGSSSTMEDDNGYIITDVMEEVEHPLAATNAQGHIMIDVMEDVEHPQAPSNAHGHIMNDVVEEVEHPLPPAIPGHHTVEVEAEEAMQPNVSEGSSIAMNEQSEAPGVSSNRMQSHHTVDIAAAEGRQEISEGSTSVTNIDIFAGHQIVDVVVAEGSQQEVLEGSSTRMDEARHPEILESSTSNGDVAEIEHPQAPTGSSNNLSRENMRKMYNAARRGHWDTVEAIYRDHPEWAKFPLSAAGNTALHIAASMNQTAFVSNLLRVLEREDTEIPNADGNTAFCVAAISGNVEIAQLLFESNAGLTSISGHQGMLPIQLAALTGHRDMVSYMSRMITRDIAQEHIRRLFFLTISNNLFQEARLLLMGNKRLSIDQNTEGLTALQLLARRPPTKKIVSIDTLQYSDYKDFLSYLYECMEQERVSFDHLREAMFDAAKSGDIEIMELICKSTPDLISKVDVKGQTVLHIAVSYRQENVFNLLFDMGAFKNLIMQYVDNDGNNILHLAGKLPPEETFGSSIANIRMQREELWFKEVEKRVPPTLQIMENKKKLTPRELFYQEHRELYKEAESAVKERLDSSMVVAALITSIVFAAAISVPSKDTQVAEDQTPIFQKKTWYVIFIISNAVALFSSSASVLSYLSILFSSFQEDVFISSLQRRLMFGLKTLFVSMATMVLAFTAASFLIFDNRSKWVAYVIASLICIPALTFLVFHLVDVKDFILDDLIGAKIWCRRAALNQHMDEAS